MITIKNLSRIYAILTLTCFSSMGYLIGHLITINNVLFSIPFTIFVGFTFIISHWILLIVSSKIDKRKKEIEEADICGDTHCGGYNECDKIHCFQFYKYNKNGIIKRD